MLKDLPFPYTSAAQLEHKLRTPMGPEWSTSTVSFMLSRPTLASLTVADPRFARIIDRFSETKRFPRCWLNPEQPFDLLADAPDLQHALSRSFHTRALIQYHC